MKSSLSLVLTTLALPAALLAGCGGGTAKPKGDMSMPIGPDMTMVSTCTQVGAWPTSISGQSTVGTFFTPDPMNGDASQIQSTDPAMNAEGNYNIIIGNAVVVPGTNEAYPITVTFSDTTTFQGINFPDMNGGAVVYMLGNCDLTSNCGNSDLELYLAQAGTFTITKADDNASGSMTASMANITLNQFTNPTNPNQAPAKIVGGKCYDVTSFSGGGPYIGGGTDGGTD